MPVDGAILGCQTATDLLSYVTRVSSPQNQSNFDTGEKLIAYCMRKHHWSPFQMIDLTMEVVTTRDIGRQILRHRSFEFQEFSQRYAEVTDPPVIREARLQDTKNRQASHETNDPELQAKWVEFQNNVANLADLTYRWAVDHGIAKEQARAVLPEGMTPTRMYVKGSLRSWYHYCQLRTGPETQKEHREVARLAWDVLCNEFAFLDPETVMLR
jgi:thymidylate synthase (FAD)